MTAEDALAQLLRHLKAANYQFIAVTPATHAIVLARATAGQTSLRDIFGWSRPFDDGDLSPGLMDLLVAADAIDHGNGQLRSKLRVASLGEDLFLHSAYPTDNVDAVFFGPDTYRFARFLKEQLPRLSHTGTLVDMGTGSGAGAIVAGRLLHFKKITMVDVNQEALRLAAINAAAAGVQADTLVSDSVPVGANLMIANPPYMVDRAKRAYRDGGGLLGGEVALEWVRQGLRRLASGGSILLYTGAAYRDGKAPLLDELASTCAACGASLEIDEIDPDVFGDELQGPPYEAVERIGALGVVIRLPTGPSTRDPDA